MENLKKKFDGTQSDNKDLFKVGEKYTIFVINSMAICSKDQIHVRGIDAEGNPIFTRGTGRKRFMLKLWSRSYQSAPLKPFDGAVFKGWDIPITCDSDLYRSGRIMRGNACFNFVGESKEIVAKFIIQNQLNPWFEIWRSLYVGNMMDIDVEEKVIFPDLYPGSHAVIDRILAKKEVDVSL